MRCGACRSIWFSRSRPGAVGECLTSAISGHCLNDGQRSFRLHAPFEDVFHRACFQSLARHLGFRIWEDDMTVTDREARLRAT